MADHNKPTLASVYADFLSQFDARLKDQAVGFDPARASPTNLVLYAVRWSSASSKWQIWNGTTWADLAAEFAMNISGYATKLKIPRTIALSGAATGTATAFDGSANIIIPVTALDASKLTGDAAWARVAAGAPVQTTRWPTFDEVTGKPTSYPPSAHTHAMTDITGLGDVAGVSLSDLPWLATPIGGYITPKSAPPTNDSRFRYIVCTAGQTGTGGYNNGVLTSESVTGSSPLVSATATVSLTGSPFNGQSIHLINSEERFVGAGSGELFENDSIQNITGRLGDIYFRGNTTPTITGAFANTVLYSGAVPTGAGTANSATIIDFNANFSPGARTSNHTQPRAHRLVHFRRIL